MYFVPNSVDRHVHGSAVVYPAIRRGLVHLLLTKGDDRGVGEWQRNLGG